jgi:hypothetical protein
MLPEQQELELMRRGVRQQQQQREVLSPVLPNKGPSAASNFALTM